MDPVSASTIASRWPSGNQATDVVHVPPGVRTRATTSPMRSNTHARPACPCATATNPRGVHREAVRSESAGQLRPQPDHGLPGVGTVGEQPPHRVRARHRDVHVAPVGRERDAVRIGDVVEHEVRRRCARAQAEEPAGRIGEARAARIGEPEVAVAGAREIAQASERSARRTRAERRHRPARRIESQQAAQVVGHRERTVGQRGEAVRLAVAFVRDMPGPVRVDAEDASVGHVDAPQVRRPPRTAVPRGRNAAACRGA